MDMKLALNIFKANNNFDEIQLWGRLSGLYNDYYIFIGTKYVRNSPFPVRDYFWAYEDFKFAPLKEPSVESLGFLMGVNGYFSGEHHKVLKKSEFNKIQDFDPENIDREFFSFSSIIFTNFCSDVIIKGNAESDITELDRLSFVVRRIDALCAVVPTESYKSGPNNELVKNIGFKGIKTGEFSL